jgi:hypothetical protein
MTTADARALLDWYRTNVCDTEPRSAHITLNRAAAQALTACATPADYDTVATALAVAVELVKEMAIYNIKLTSAAWLRGITEGRAAQLMLTPPAEYEVQFNNQRVYLWLNDELLADATLTENV